MNIQSDGIGAVFMNACLGAPFLKRNLLMLSVDIQSVGKICSLSLEIPSALGNISFRQW